MELGKPLNVHNLNTVSPLKSPLHSSQTRIQARPQWWHYN